MPRSTRSRPSPPPPRLEFLHLPRKSLEQPTPHEASPRSMAHRGDPPGRTEPPTAETKPRAQEQTRMLEELQRNHKTVLEALLLQTTAANANPAFTTPFSTTWPPLAFTGIPGAGGAGTMENQELFGNGAMKLHLELVNQFRDNSHDLDTLNQVHEMDLARNSFAKATLNNGSAPMDVTRKLTVMPDLNQSPDTIVVHRSRNRIIPVEEYRLIDGPLHVARELDVDDRGRTLVGVESGPHKELRVALQRLGANPRYGALHMADELILLTDSAVLYRDDQTVKSPNGALRFLITNDGYQAAVRAHGSWLIDSDLVEDVINDVMDEAERVQGLENGGGFESTARREERRHSGKQQKQVRAYERKVKVSPTPEPDNDGKQQARGRGRPRKYPLPENPGTTSAEDRGSPFANANEGRRKQSDSEGWRTQSNSGAGRMAATASSGSETSVLSSDEDDDADAPMCGESSEDDEGNDRGKRRKTVVERLAFAAQRAAAQRRKQTVAELGKRKGKQPSAAVKGPPSLSDLQPLMNHRSKIDAMDIEPPVKMTDGIEQTARGVATATLDIPFLNVEVTGSDKTVTDDTPQNPPSLEEYHALRGLVLGSADVSIAIPAKPPPPVGDAQFQLATPTNPYHVLALRCDINSAENDFGIRVSESGLVYVLKRDSPKASKTFEFVARFPKPVNETSAQSVFQEGVLFVVVEPKETKE